MKSYQSLADSYDALMADAEHRRRAAFLMRAFRKSKPAVHTVLDLACGTGTIACLLAQAGYQVTATDASEEMLTQAAQKAAPCRGSRLCSCASPCRSCGCWSRWTLPSPRWTL